MQFEYTMGTDENKHIGAAKPVKNWAVLVTFLPMAAETVNQAMAREHTFAQLG
jgi:hypothetical protein